MGLSEHPPCHGIATIEGTGRLAISDFIHSKNYSAIWKSRIGIIEHDPWNSSPNNNSLSSSNNGKTDSEQFNGFFGSIQAKDLLNKWTQIRDYLSLYCRQPTLPSDHNLRTQLKSIGVFRSYLHKLHETGSVLHSLPAKLQESLPFPIHHDNWGRWALYKRLNPITHENIIIFLQALPPSCFNIAN